MCHRYVKYEYDPVQICSMTNIFNLNMFNIRPSDLAVSQMIKKGKCKQDRPGNIWVLKRIFSLLTHLIYPNYRLNKRVTVLISGFVQTESHFELCGSIMNQYLVSSLIALYVSMYLIMTCLVSNTFLRMRTFWVHPQTIRFSFKIRSAIRMKRLFLINN